MPPWIAGCSVFTRPSMISGKPVWSLTSITSTPASRRVLAEPPVDRIATPCAASAWPSPPTPEPLDAGVAQGPGRASGRQEPPPVRRQRLAELDQPGLVRDGNQRPLDL